MGIDVERVRSETRYCDSQAHFNNAGASLPPSVVTDTVVRQLQKDEALGGYEAQLIDSAESLAQVYVSIANLVGATSDEIAITDSSTRGWQSALYAMDWQAGDRIVTSEAEYSSNVYAYGVLARERGVETVYVADDARGQVDLRKLEGAIDARTKLVTATHIPTYGGLINPAAKIGEIAKSAGIPYLLDACQSVGHLHLDVDEIGCDILSTAGRKYLRGPRGTGFVYIRKSLLEKLRPQIADGFSATWASDEGFELRADARRFETFERSPALHLGLGAAADYAISLGTKAIEERILSLATHLRGLLAAIPKVRVEDVGASLSGIVTFSVRGIAAEQVVTMLRARKINTSLVPAESAMRSFPKRGLSSVVRASIHYYNTEEEIQLLCDALTTFEP